MDKNTLYDFLNKKIYHWVGMNFGLKEAEEPSWNIEALSDYLAREITDKDEQLSSMTSHELTVLLHKDAVSDTAMSDITEKIKHLGGVVNKQECEGIKRLAYSINGEESANYFYLDISLPNGKPAELSSWLNINDCVLRYLLVKADTRRR